MKRVWSIVAWLSLVLVVVVAAAIAFLWFEFPLDGTTITVGDESFSLSGLSDGQLAALWAVAVLATVGALVVGAAATVVGLAVGALGVGLVVFSTIAAIAVVASPFLLLGWLVWRVVRGRPRATATTAATA